MEYVENGSLTSIVRKFGTMSEKLCVHYIYQVLEGLRFLHNEGIIHRDIKGANILIGSNKKVKLADFGVASKLKEENKTLGSDPAGTPYWMAPEIIELNPASTASDIWSVGATIIELLTGHPPYFDLQAMPALYRIVQDEHPPLPKNISKSCRKFLLSCFHKDPSMRPTADQLLNNKWITKNVNKGKMAISQNEHEFVNISFGSKYELERKSSGKSFKKIKSEIPKSMLGKDGVEETLHLTHMRETGIAPNTATLMDLDENDRKEIKRTDFSDCLDSPDDDNFIELLGGFSRNELKIRLKKRIAPTDSLCDDREEESNYDSNFEEKMEVVFEDLEQVEPGQIEQLKREKNMIELLAVITPEKSDEELVVVIEKLSDLVSDPSMKNKLYQYHGIVPLMDLIDSENHSEKVIENVMAIFNMAAMGNVRLLETLCLTGILPSVIAVAKRSSSVSVRRECSIFLNEVCHASPLTLQMFVACKGLKILVDYLDHDVDDTDSFFENRDLIFRSIDNILKIFSEEKVSRTPKNDYCRLFSKHKIVYFFQLVMRTILRLDEMDTEMHGYMTKLTELTLLFSQADSVVKKAMSEEKELEMILGNLNYLEGEAIDNMLKCIRNLALDPITFENFEKVNGIELLVPYLGMEEEGGVNKVLNALYSLCRVHKERQKRAALAGIIPHLQHLIQKDNPLKGFALELYCAFTRLHDEKVFDQLWEFDGVTFFIYMLNFDTWQPKVMDSLRFWMIEDQKRVVSKLTKNENLQKLVSHFEKMSQKNFMALLSPMYKIIIYSKKFARGLADNGAFLKLLSKYMKMKCDDAYIKVLFLRIVKTIYQYSAHPKRMIKEMHPIIQAMECTESATVLQKNLAKQILTAFEQNVKA